MTKIKNINQTALFVMSCLLKQGKNIDIASALITIMTIIIYCVSLFQKIPLIGSLGIVVFLFWLMQKYYAIRTSIDRDLFTYLAKDSQLANQRINELSDCLTHLKLTKKTNQNWLERQRGALSLLKKQFIFFVGQVILFLIILASLFFNS